MTADAGDLAPRQAGDDDVVFAEPWHAEVLAVAAALTERGVFTRSQWSDALAAARNAAAAAGVAESQAAYYEAALAALESLLAGTGAVSAAAMTQRTESWRSAYLATPHGEPVLLRSPERP